MSGAASSPSGEPVLGKLAGEGASQRRTGRGGILAALWFWLFVAYLDRVAMSFAGPAIMTSLALDPASLGLILSSFNIGYLVAQFPGGFVADRVGGRTMLVLGPLLWAALIGATGLAATVVAFAAVRIGLGIAEGMTVPAVPKTVGDNFESRERARAWGIVFTATALAPAFAGALVGKLIGAYGWQTMFFILAVPALAAAALVGRLVPARPPAASGEAGADGEMPFRKLLGRPSFWLLATIYFAFNIAYWGYLGWMPSYLALAHHVDLHAVGWLASIPYLFAFLGLLLAGWLGSGPFPDKRPQLGAAFLLLGGLSLALAYGVGTLALSLAGLSGAAFSLFAMLGLLGAITLDIAPGRHRGALIGVLGTIGQTGGLLAPAVIGFLVAWTGSFAAGFGVMVLALVAAAASLLALIPLMPAIGATVAPAA